MTTSKLVSLFLTLWITELSCQVVDKACRMSQLDTKMKPTVKLSKDVIWPVSEQEIDVMCSTYPKYLSEVRNYSKKCTKGQSKTILSVTTHSIEKQTVKLYCKGKNEKNERKKLMDAAKCINTGRTTASKCWNKLVSSMTAAGNVSNSKDKIPLLCCSLLKWKDCFIKVYEDSANVCTTDHIEYMDQYLYKSMIDPLNIFCADYDDSDKCNKFSDFFAKSSNTKVKYGTPFPAILNLFESL